MSEFKSPFTVGAMLASKADHNRRQSDWDSDPPERSGPRALWEIAADVVRCWPKINFGAVPYLDAMSMLNHVDQEYGCDSGRSVVLYFLSNAKTFRGADARRIKLELKALLK